jgi:hypothetical protein
MFPVRDDQARQMFSCFEVIAFVKILFKDKYFEE